MYECMKGEAHNGLFMRAVDKIHTLWSVPHARVQTRRLSRRLRVPLEAAARRHEERGQITFHALVNITVN